MSLPKLGAWRKISPSSKLSFKTFLKGAKKIHLSPKIDRAYIVVCFQGPTILQLISPAIDEIKDTVDEMTKGSRISTELVEAVKKVVKMVDDTIQETERKMQELTEKIGSVGVRSNKITGVAFEKYDQVKKDLRAARRKLRSLADKTKTASQDMEIYLEGWDATVDNADKRRYLKEQVGRTCIFLQFMNYMTRKFLNKFF